jgi:predicted MFS family arabinose efflux permease
MLLFYCSAYLVRGFFALYWQQQSGIDNSLLAAAVFALPAVMALLGLWQARRRQQRGLTSGGLRHLWWLGAAGLLLQAQPWLPLLLLGRCLFGWALFQLTVWLDVQLFRHSSPARYARDYSRISLCQNLGVLLSSSAAGALVAGHGLLAPFVVAALGLLLCWLLSPVLLREPAPALSQGVCP